MNTKIIMSHQELEVLKDVLQRNSSFADVKILGSYGFNKIKDNTVVHIEFNFNAQVWLLSKAVALEVVYQRENNKPSPLNRFSNLLCQD